MWRRASATLPSLARVGLKRVFATGGSLPPDARRAAGEFGASPREARADRVEFAQLPTVFEQTKALTSLDGKPLYVLTAEIGNQRGWRPAQRKLANLSTNSLHRTATGATVTRLCSRKSNSRVSRAERSLMLCVPPGPERRSPADVFRDNRRRATG